MSFWGNLVQLQGYRIRKKKFIHNMNCFGSKCPHSILNKLQTNLLQLTGKVLFHFELVRLSGSFVCHRYHMVLLKQGSILSSSKIFFWKEGYKRDRTRNLADTKSQWRKNKTYQKNISKEPKGYLNVIVKVRLCLYVTMKN